jgi:hypothetical protein
MVTFPPRWPGFDLRSVHVGFVVEKLALGKVFIPCYSDFPHQLSLRQLLRIQYSSRHRCYIILIVTASLNKQLQNTKKRENNNSNISKSQARYKSILFVRPFRISFVSRYHPLVYLFLYFFSLCQLTVGVRVYGRRFYFAGNYLKNRSVYDTNVFPFITTGAPLIMASLHAWERVALIFHIPEVPG